MSKAWTSRRLHIGSAQLVAVIMLLQPLVGVVAADLAARNPLFAALLTSLCRPGQGTDAPAGPRIRDMACCLAGSTCFVGGCCAPPMALTAVPAQSALASLAYSPVPADDRLSPHRSSRWPAATGPPIT